MTNDHVPPRGFFPEPRPSNLITVPCCRRCNKSWELEDEAVRAFFTLDIARSEVGDAIWDNKVIAGTVKRSSAFREYMLARTHNRAIAGPSGIEFLPAFDVPNERVHPFMERITKGLLRHYYPLYDYSSSTFTVRHIPATEANLQSLEKFLGGSNYDERGEGVVRYRYANTDTESGGFWFYTFYDAVWYLVLHKKTSPSTQS